MADVSLDDLIKKDREQHKANRNKVPLSPLQKLQHKKFPPGKKFNQNQDRQGNNKDEQDNRPFKKKFIKKQHDDNRNQQREQREPREPKQDKFKNRPPKSEKTEENK